MTGVFLFSAYIFLKLHYRNLEEYIHFFHNKLTKSFLTFLKMIPSDDVCIHSTNTIQGRYVRIHWTPDATNKLQRGKLNITSHTHISTLWSGFSLCEWPDLTHSTYDQLVHPLSWGDQVPTCSPTAFCSNHWFLHFFSMEAVQGVLPGNKTICNV